MSNLPVAITSLGRPLARAAFAVALAAVSLLVLPAVASAQTSDPYGGVLSRGETPERDAGPTVESAGLVHSADTGPGAETRATAVSGAARPSGGRVLAVTGSDVAGFVLLGGGAVAAGAALVVVSRRRRPALSG